MKLVRPHGLGKCGLMGRAKGSLFLPRHRSDWQEADDQDWGWGKALQTAPFVSDGRDQDKSFPVTAQTQTWLIAGSRQSGLVPRNIFEYLDLFTHPIHSSIYLAFIDQSFLSIKFCLNFLVGFTFLKILVNIYINIK